MEKSIQILIGGAARGRPQRYKAEIDAVLPSQLSHASFSFDMHDEDDIWGSEIESCNAIILTSRGLGTEGICRAKRLRFVQKLGIVADRVDIKSCLERNIAVSILSDPGHVAVAEHTILLILAAARHLPQTHNAVVRGDNPQKLNPIATTQNVRNSNWLGLQGSSFPLLADSTIGLIGFGEIAREVAIRACAFGATLIYTKRVRLDPVTESYYGVSFVTFEELLSRAHFVSVHATQPDHLPTIVDARAIELMRKDAVLINTARGNQVDERALIAALKEQRIRGAALDVYCVEPPINSGLRGLPNVVITPHTGGLTLPGLRFRAALENVVAVDQGRKPLGLIQQ